MGLDKLLIGLARVAPHSTSTASLDSRRIQQYRM